jgi:[protein]-arginine 3-hydroxylase / protease
VETYSEKDATQTYLSDSWEQRVMSLGEFIETHIEAPPRTTETDGDGEGVERGYLAQYQLFDQIPCLREDIQVPSYCHALTAEDTLAPHSEFAGDARTAEDPLISAWFGPAGTVSPLHNDPYHNILAQVVGRKYLRLYDMKLTGNMYPRDGFQCNNSSVDIDDVDGERYPLFSTTSSFQCVLERGEMLYIPRHFWHYVRSLDVSFSVSFWYGAKMGLVKNDTSGEYEAVYS